MIKHCKCNSVEDDFCDFCQSAQDECICAEQEEGHCRKYN